MLSKETIKRGERVTEILKTVEIDTEKGVYKINGEDVSKTCSKFLLSFENGRWTLETEETKRYLFPAPQKAMV